MEYLDKMNVSLYRESQLIKEDNKGYVLGNVLLVSNNIIEKLYDLNYEDDNFDMWDWCLTNLDIIRIENEKDINNL